MQATLTDSKIISFTTNWNNKLDCDQFTTFRLHNDAKYVVGETYTVKLKSKVYKRVRIVSKKVVTLNQVNEWVARIDTGYSLEEFKGIVTKMYCKAVKNFAHQQFDLILCETLKDE